MFFPGCAAPLGMNPEEYQKNQIKVATYSTGINMRARDARLNNNGGRCVKIFENYVVKKEKYSLLSKFLDRYKCKWICCQESFDECKQRNSQSQSNIPIKSKFKYSPGHTPGIWRLFLPERERMNLVFPGAGHLITTHRKWGIWSLASISC